MTKAVTINLDDAEATDLERIAAENGVTLEEVLSEAVRRYIEQGEEGDWAPSDEDMAAIQKGWEAAERGDLVSHEEVMEGARRIVDGEAG